MPPTFSLPVVASSLVCSCACRALTKEARQEASHGGLQDVRCSPFSQEVYIDSGSQESNTDASCMIAGEFDSGEKSVLYPGGDDTLASPTTYW